MFQQCRKHSWKIIWWIMTAISLHLTLLTTYWGAIFKKWIPNILQWLMYQWNCASCLRGKTKTFHSLSWFCVRGYVKHLAAEVGPKKGYSVSVVRRWTCGASGCSRGLCCLPPTLPMLLVPDYLNFFCHSLLHVQEGGEHKCSNGKGVAVGKHRVL